MAAYAEGLNVLAKANVGRELRAKDAETAPLAAPAVLPLRPRPRRDHRAVAAGQRHLQLAARPHRAGAARRPAARPLRRTRQRQRRGSVDAARRDRGGRAGAGAQRLAVPAVLLPRPRPTSPTRCCRRCARSSAATLEDESHDDRLPSPDQGACSRHRPTAAPPPMRSCCSARPATSPSASCSRRCTSWRSTASCRCPVDRRRPQRLDRRRVPRARPRGDRRGDPATRRSRRRRLADDAARPDPGRLLGPGDVGEPARHARQARQPSMAVFYMAIPPSMFPTVAQSLGVASASTSAAGSSSRSRSAATSTARSELNDDAALGVPRGADLPHRPLPRQGERRGPARVPLLQHDARAGVEPQLRPQRADHDGRDDRRRGAGQLLRQRRRDPRRDAEPPPPGGGAGRDGAAGRARSRGSCRTRRPRCSRRCARSTRRRSCAASTSATATSRASTPTRRRETFAAARLEIDSWRWAGVPWYVRCGKALAAAATEVVVEFRDPPSLLFDEAGGPTPQPQPRPLPARQERRRDVHAAGEDARASTSTARTSTSRSTSPPRSASGGRPTSACSTTPSPARRAASPARTSSSRRGASSSRRSTSPAPSTPTSAARGAPPKPTASSAATLVRRHCRSATHDPVQTPRVAHGRTRSARIDGRRGMTRRCRRRRGGR